MRVRFDVVSAFSPRAALLALLAVTSACATTGARVNPATVPPPVTYEMEPIKITAVKGPDGQHLETF
ncbi:MAG TPA: hypothetical protein VGL59_18060, partial [Polyangia bacterium]